MLSGKICFTKDLLDKRVICDSGKDMIQSKNFYILLERFCNIISREEPQFDVFLNKYFNDEGYVDVWRIPNLLIDICNCNYKFHSNTLDDSEFKGYFTRFLVLFNNYCICEYKLCLVDEQNLNGEKSIVLQIKENQHLMNIIMDTFCRIIENTEAYKRME